MSQVYVISDDGSTQPMDRVRCTNEDRELQRLLEKNPDLLPGDQMNPDDPRRWLLIKREMPVQDPSTGSDRWSIDFFFTDQSAIPTFVECKRYADTRARREVIGQMLEYAANGHYYWSKDMIRSYAEANAGSHGTTIEEAIHALQPDDEETPDELFSRIQENLREGQIRLVFFLEEAPMELKSVVDFLNKQMERSEVLLVEARQFSLNGVVVVTPTLFGFTEEARKAKRRVIVSIAARKKWSESLFFADAEDRLAPEDVIVIRELFDYCRSSSFDVTYGTGARVGSIQVKRPPLFSKSLISVFSDGRLVLNFGWTENNDTALKIRDYLKDCAVSRLGFDVPDDYTVKYPEYIMPIWKGKISELISILKEIEGKLNANDA